MPSIALQVSTDPDDGYEFEDNGTVISINTTSTPPAVTNEGAVRIFTGAASNQRRWGLTRFLNVAIPQGVIITSAIWQGFVPTSNKWDDPDVTVHAHDADTSTSLPHADNSFDITSRPRTTANVVWNTTAPVGPVWVVSPNLASVIQEVIDRPGWASGNSLSIILRAGTSGQSFVFTAYGGVPANAAKLDIEWANAGAANLSGAGDMTAAATTLDNATVNMSGVGDLQATTSSPLCLNGYIAYDYGGAFFCLENLGDFVDGVDPNIRDVCIITCDD